MDSEGLPGFNTFNNDGSFMETFMKMKGQEPQPPAATTASPAIRPNPPLMTRKPLIMKMSGKKKKKTPLLMKPTKAVLEDDSVKEETLVARTKGEDS